jgi:hypothetical protein
MSLTVADFKAGWLREAIQDVRSEDSPYSSGPVYTEYGNARAAHIQRSEGPSEQAGIREQSS